MNRDLEECFTRFEALFTRGSIFVSPKVPVSVVNPAVSDTLCINPSLSAQATSLVRPPAEESVTKESSKLKSKEKTKKTHKDDKYSKPKGSTFADTTGTSTTNLPKFTIQPDIPGPGSDSASKPKDKQFTSSTVTPVEVKAAACPASQTIQPTMPLSLCCSSDPASSGGDKLEISVDSSGFLDEPIFGTDPHSDIESYEEGEVSRSEILDKKEKNDMNYQETVRLVRAFLGWHHIPYFKIETSVRTDRIITERVNIPGSQEKPPNDSLCEKMERLICNVAEEDPSRDRASQFLAGVIGKVM